MPEWPDRRDDGREQSLLRIGCLILDERRELCLLRNISAGGALARTYSEIPSGQAVAIELRQGESVAGVVRWSEGNMIGIMFNQPVDVLQLLADSSDWPRPRQPRVEISAPISLRRRQQKSIAEALDLSQGGLKARSTVTLDPGELVRVALDGLPEMEAVCRWASTEDYGLEFCEPLSLKSLVRWVREYQAALLDLKRTKGATA